MFNIILENEKGSRLTFGAGTSFTIKEFSGLNPPKATISTNETAFMDGVKFNSAKLNARTINLAFTVDTDPEQSRKTAFAVIQPKKYIKIIFESELLDCFCEGYVESIDVSYFAKKQTITVSILCPYPYLKATNQTIDEMSAVTPMFAFPFPTSDDIVFGQIDTLASFDVTNDGNAETGLIFELYAKQAVSNPKIYDYVSGEYMEINIDMVLGDLITITTEPGNKTIKLLRNGETTNIFNLLTKESTWLMLPLGGSTYAYEVGTGSTTNLLITIKHYDLYEGV